jgi:hypothetical protein
MWNQDFILLKEKGIYIITWSASVLLFLKTAHISKQLIPWIIIFNYFCARPHIGLAHRSLARAQPWSRAKVTCAGLDPSFFGGGRIHRHFCLSGWVRQEASGRQHLHSLLRSMQKPRALPPLIPCGGHSEQQRPTDRAKCGISSPLVLDPISSCDGVLAPGKEVRRRRQVWGRGPPHPKSYAPPVEDVAEGMGTPNQTVLPSCQGNEMGWGRRGKEAPPLGLVCQPPLLSNGQRRLLRRSNGTAWKEWYESRWGLDSGLGWTGSAQSWPEQQINKKIIN